MNDNPQKKGNKSILLQYRGETLSLFIFILHLVSMIIRDKILSSTMLLIIHYQVANKR